MGGLSYKAKTLSFGMLQMQENAQESNGSSEGAWDKEERDRFNEMLTKAIRSNAAQAKNIAKSSLTSTSSPTASYDTDPTPLSSPDAEECEKGDESFYKKWLTFIKSASRNSKVAGRDNDEPRFSYVERELDLDVEIWDGEEEMSAMAKWQRTDGPFYIQFTGGWMMLGGFLNYIALNNQNGSGVPGLSQQLWFASILVTLIGFALERNSPSKK